jgi:drug/metabolite transporter (DMT)-like permease
LPTPLARVLFVFLWSTGFVVARLAAEHADPLTFLLFRFIGATCLLGGLALATGARWPVGWRGWRDQAVAGVMMHAAYLGGVWAAIGLGMAAGVSALIVSLQPLLTAMLAAALIGERVDRRQWLGLSLGLVGVALVLADKLGQPGGDAPAVGLALLALAGITAGTLWQKRIGGASDLLAGATVQYAAGALCMGLVAPLAEPMRFDPAWPALMAYLWATVLLSFVEVILFYRLVRDGAAAQVVALMYLVPAVTAIIAWAMFDETLSTPALIGLPVVAFGVALATRSSR